MGRLLILVMLLASALDGHADISFRAASSVAGQAGGVTYVAAVENSGQGTNVTEAIPGAAAAGDLLLVVLAVESTAAAAISAPAGWTPIRADSAADHTQAAYYRFATAADVAGSATWNWSWGATTRDFSSSILAFRGVDAAAPVNAHNGAVGAGNSTAMSAPAVTPSVAGTLLVAAVSIRSQSTFSGWSGGAAERTDDRSANAADEIAHGTATRAGPAAGASSGATTATASVADTSRIGQTIALAPAGAVLTMPEGTGEGDLMVAVIAVETQADASVTMSGGGFTRIRGDNAADHTQVLYYRFATAADVASAGTSWNWSWGASVRDYSASLLVFRGVDASNPIDADAGQIGAGTSGTVNIPAVTPSVAGTVLVAAASIRSQSTFGGWSGSLAELTDARSGTTANEIGGATATRAGPTAGASSGAFTVTASTNDNSRIGATLALTPAAVPGPVLRWRMDEGAWSGASGEVRDASGSGLHGTAFNGANTTATNAKFCRSGGFDGANQYVETANTAQLSITDRLTVAAWVRPTGYGAELKTIASKDANYEFHLTSAGNVNWWWTAGANAITTTGTAPLGAWTHVAIVYARGAQEVFINGVLDTHNWAAPDRNALVANGNPFQVGQDQNAAGRFFNGLIDEVLLYHYAMSAADVANLYNETVSCLPDHFNIGHAGTGVACSDQTITLTAHDASHNAVDAGGVAVALSTTNNKGSWTGIVSGGGSLSDGTAGDGAATYTFAPGASSAQLSFRYANLPATSETFGFNALSGSISEATGGATAGDDPSFTMAQAGFEFRNVTDGGTAIPLQLSGKPSNTGFNARTIRLRAVRTDTSTGSCVALFANQSRTVELGAECGSPAGCAGGQAAVNGAALPTSDDNGGAGAAAYTSVSLTFNAGSEADTVITYPDAGRISLHARYDLDPLVAGFEMQGSSSAFVVRPFGLAFPGATHASTAAAGVLAAAGDFFPLTLAAYQWAAGEDANDDGVPDAGANITDNGTTPNYAASATVSASANLPGAAVGNVSRGVGCTGAADIAITGGSAAAADWCYSEAGNVRLSAVASDYLGSGSDVMGSSAFDGDAGGGYVGRFRPKYFAVSGAALTNRAAAACSPASAFTYLDEGLSVAFTLKAQNAQGATTQNYTGVYAKLDPTDLDHFVPGARSGATDLTARLDTGVPPSGAWANGTLALTTTLAVQRAAPDAPDGPFPAVAFGIAPVDSDGTAMQTLDFDADGNGVAERKSLGVSTELRYGRLRLQSAAGSAAIPLRVPVAAQYWNGAAFATNTLDSCTSIPRSAVALGFAGGAALTACETSMSSPSTTLSSGTGALVLAAPGAGNQGSVVVSVNVDAAAGSYCNPSSYVPASSALMGYLAGRWNDAADPDGDPQTAYDDNPGVRAAFGVYGAKPRNFIFFRENY